MTTAPLAPRDRGNLPDHGGGGRRRRCRGHRAPRQSPRSSRPSFGALASDRPTGNNYYRPTSAALLRGGGDCALRDALAVRWLPRAVRPRGVGHPPRQCRPVGSASAHHRPTGQTASSAADHDRRGSNDSTAGARYHCDRCGRDERFAAPPVGGLFSDSRCPAAERRTFSGTPHVHRARLQVWPC